MDSTCNEEVQAEWDGFTIPNPVRTSFINSEDCVNYFASLSSWEGDIFDDKREHVISWAFDSFFYLKHSPHFSSYTDELEWIDEWIELSKFILISCGHISAARLEFREKTLLWHIGKLLEETKVLVNAGISEMIVVNTSWIEARRVDIRPEDVAGSIFEAVSSLGIAIVTCVIEACFAKFCGVSALTVANAYPVTGGSKRERSVLGGGVEARDIGQFVPRTGGDTRRLGKMPFDPGVRGDSYFQGVPFDSGGLMEECFVLFHAETAYSAGMYFGAGDRCSRSDWVVNAKDAAITSVFSLLYNFSGRAGVMVAFKAEKIGTVGVAIVAFEMYTCAGVIMVGLRLGWHDACMDGVWSCLSGVAANVLIDLSSISFLSIFSGMGVSDICTLAVLTSEMIPSCSLCLDWDLEPGFSVVTAGMDCGSGGGGATVEGFPSDWGGGGGFGS